MRAGMSRIDGTRNVRIIRLRSASGCWRLGTVLDENGKNSSSNCSFTRRMGGIAWDLMQGGIQRKKSLQEIEKFLTAK